MNKESSNIVLIEDEPRIREFVKAALESAGHSVQEASTVQRGLIDAGNRKPDLIVLDLGLPDRDGLDFIREFRSWSSVPILVLSARSQEEDKIVALDLGADDYLVKPFGLGELMARVRAALRRRRPATDTLSLLQFGDVTVDFSTRQVTRAGQPVHLTPIEFRLLTYLGHHVGRVVTHRQVLQEVWGPAHAEDTHYLRIYMGHLRQKLEENASNPQYLLTEAGVGYRFIVS
jgi:two-component system KDP operon response regulator KdpE